MSRLVKVKLELVDGTHLIANQSGVADGSGQWENKLIDMTPFKRNVTLDRKFQRGGITITIDDSNGAYKAMFASDTNRKIFGKTVTIYVYLSDGVTIAETIVTTINNWSPLDAKKITFECVQEFSGAMGAIPVAQALVINNTDFPDAWGRALGKPVLFPTGTCDNRHGAIDVWKVVNRNTPLAIDAKYLITKSDPLGDPRITSILDVFENSARVSSGGVNYELIRDANGWEYVNYNGDAQMVSINVVAVSDPGTAGDNPVVALRGILTAAGVTLVDDGDGGASDFEDYCTAQTWAMGAAPKESPQTIDYIETWSQNFNCFWRLDAAGAIHIKHIDWAAVTADATMVEEHFDALVEKPDMSKFANRVRSKFDYGNATWGTELVTDSTTGDYLPATIVKEMTEDYLLAVFGGATTPITEKIKFYDRVQQTITATIPLKTYEILGLSLLKVADVTHTRQIGASGKYLIMDESMNWLGENVQVAMLRLWGV